MCRGVGLYAGQRAIEAHPKILRGRWTAIRVPSASLMEFGLDQMVDAEAGH